MNISELGDSTLLLCFDNSIEPDINARVLAVYLPALVAGIGARGG